MLVVVLEVAAVVAVVVVVRVGVVVAAVVPGLVVTVLVEAVADALVDVEVLLVVANLVVVVVGLVLTVDVPLAVVAELVVVVVTVTFPIVVVAAGTSGANTGDTGTGVVDGVGVATGSSSAGTRGTKGANGANVGPVSTLCCCTGVVVDASDEGSKQVVLPASVATVQQSCVPGNNEHGPQHCFLPAPARQSPGEASRVSTTMQPPPGAACPDTLSRSRASGTAPPATDAPVETPHVAPT